MTPREPRGDQVEAVLGVVTGALPAATLRGLYRYGSSVVGGLRGDSDLDFFGVLDRRLQPDERRALVRGLIPISSRATRPSAWRPVELTLVVEGDVRPWRYPPRLEFQYGEWLREDLVRGDLEPMSEASPDLAVLITMVLEHGVPEAGPAAGDLLDPVPRGDLLRAMLDEMPGLLADLESDTRNVVLTLARIWTTAATGQLRSKDAAAEWALAHLPDDHRPVLVRARAGYLGEDGGPSEPEAMSRTRDHADYVVERIRLAAGALPPPDASV